MSEQVKLTVRCRAFTCEGVRENKILVEPDGLVRVWDSIAGHYVTAHRLSEATQSRIRKLAEKKRTKS